MKRTLILILLFFTKIVFAQETEFKLSKEGFTDYLVIDCKNLSQSELYTKALDWINVTYNTPSEVIKGKIENDYIRIEGFAHHVISSGTKYQIEISFKDGKYKFDIIDIQFISGFDGQWKKFDIINTSEYVDQDGRIIRKAKVWNRVTNYFNSLNSSLQKFILSDKIPSKTKDW